MDRPRVTLDLENPEQWQGQLAEWADTDGILDLCGSSPFDVPVPAPLLAMIPARDRGIRAIDCSHRDLEQVAWHGCVFTDDAVFDRAVFTGEADLRGARFGGRAGFSGTRFLGQTYFHGVTFEGSACFAEAVFHSDSNFEEATFTGEASFTAAQFTEGAVRPRHVPSASPLRSFVVRC